jgi:prepilin-type N-terminal cleavage/methylation domain-containing protein
MSNQNRKTSLGFTLVELLVVISIIGFLSGLFIVAYQGAAQESNTLKTRSTIQKISEVLNSRMDEYISYPIAIRTPLGGSIPSNAVPVPTLSAAPESKTTVIMRERARLLALRDLIRMEMPDHPDDIKYTTYWKDMMSPTDFQSYLEGRVPFTTFPGLAKIVPTGLYSLPNPPSSQYLMKGTLTARTKALMTRLSQSSWTPLFQWDKFNANAELLYLIVEGSDLNGSSAIELFGKTEIGDTDGDGLNEFIDAFGVPIRWIRWPAGFPGSSRYHPDMLDPNLVSSAHLSVTSEPVDRLGTDPGWGTAQEPGTGLSPLVISAGRDRFFGIRFREIDVYTPPSVLPTNVGTFDGKSSYSTAEAPWTLSSYGLVNFADPWFPRVPSTFGVRMGETVGGAVYDLENGRQASGVNAGDNVSNFDGTGVSL